MPVGELQDKNMGKKLFFFFILDPLSLWREKSDPELDPDPLVRGADPRIRIRIKMSRIPDTANKNPWEARITTGSFAKERNEGEQRW